MKTATLRHWVAIGTAAVLTFAGCGSSGRDSSQTDTASSATKRPAAGLTKAEFITRADVVCRRLKAEQKPLLARAEAIDRSSPASDAGPLGSILRQQVEQARTAHAKLRALPVPPGDSATIKMLLDGYDEEDTDAIDLAGTYAAEEPAAEAVAMATLKKAVESNRGLAHRYGFKVCGTLG